MHHFQTCYSLFALFSLFYADEINGEGILYDTVVIFGDSNSDSGNVFNMTSGAFPPSPFPYFQGRFSNGYVWCERFNVSIIINKAYGGATTDDNFIQSISLPSSVHVPGVRQQIANYSSSVDKNAINFDRTLYVVWAGGNNYLRNNSLTPFSIISSLVNATRDLLVFDIKHLILVNQPPLQSVPLLQPLRDYTNLSELTDQYNTNLSQHIGILRKQYRNVNIQLFDLNSLISRVLANPNDYGILDITNSCWESENPDSLCLNPDAHVFFDAVHFTRRIHQLIADDFKQFLRSAAIGLFSFHLPYTMIYSVFFFFSRNVYLTI